MKIFLMFLFRRLVVVVILIGLGFVLFFGYPYIFSRVVTGEITGAKHVLDTMAVISTGEAQSQIPNKVFSFAIAIRDHKSSEIVTGSSEDRQWAAVKEGQCARAEFFPYPPWQITKAGTYFGVRLLSLYDNCEMALKK
ncbi:MAG: hypothetical protein AABY64_13775 [Bdellovibrionota bacterium]